MWVTSKRWTAGGPAASPQWQVSSSNCLASDQYVRRAGRWRCQPRSPRFRSGRPAVERTWPLAASPVPRMNHHSTRAPTAPGTRRRRWFPGRWSGESGSWPSQSGHRRHHQEGQRQQRSQGTQRQGHHTLHKTPAQAPRVATAHSFNRRRGQVKLAAADGQRRRCSTRRPPAARPLSTAITPATPARSRGWAGARDELGHRRSARAA